MRGTAQNVEVTALNPFTIVVNVQSQQVLQDEGDGAETTKAQVLAQGRDQHGADQPLLVLLQWQNAAARSQDPFNCKKSNTSNRLQENVNSDSSDTGFSDSESDMSGCMGHQPKENPTAMKDTGVPFRLMEGTGDDGKGSIRTWTQLNVMDRADVWTAVSGPGRLRATKIQGLN
ncbi:hypothetical protein Bbelb_351110 [Branchiostoma belcheri]|nr:hypothetical protein Bbelb_351110 [Branchiostoma belcheri]